MNKKAKQEALTDIETIGYQMKMVTGLIDRAKQICNETHRALPERTKGNNLIKPEHCRCIKHASVLEVQLFKPRYYNFSSAKILPCRCSYDVRYH